MRAALWVIIPAAGVGKRMQSTCPKQYLRLADNTILDTTIERFIQHPNIAGVLVGISQEDEYWCQSKWRQHASVHTFTGGKERCDTVQKGVSFLSQSCLIDKNPMVLVHDAARPLLSLAALNRIIEHESDQGALLAVPVKDTLKQQHQTSLKVEATLPRERIWLAQTPQKFPVAALLAAFEQAQREGVVVTDECSAMERMGWQPDLVLGDSRNIKVTVPEDLGIAEALLPHMLATGAL
ncbi:2-C-methyl-D-erythritol 4-phosphate cytidylyltransferase [Marinomonas algarum]|uniref:2-C-methyl-D-erythritol 4-phosphate cytidylyltransferase n=1 Tax=Marinomonas algarum TaxID=2883105 RepID=A0A9X1LEU1_9GAMM|nr:2-C-methyl-D-erythritol 4-phosphate cytidylyltransferase [Marinomonas algarum]MCB5162026.1 2-C-methyl-D-erythritol 4-phosphate cytidylyltransferase [Marinomonas algarum]